jgi:hypothetical protein
MTRDFAKKSSYKKRKKQSSNKIIVGLLLIVVIIFLGGTFFYYYGIFKQRIAATSYVVKEEVMKPLTKVEKFEVKPRFEFYNMLASQKDENKYLNGDIGKTKNTRVIGEEKGIYILQIAAFRQIGEAKILMLDISKKGFKAGLKQDGEHKWTRVQVGPYASKITAEQEQKKLKELNFNSILIKVG